eukprot:scaffold1323_cov255-Pinguiococcus_pyrenoidosus.AAC.8
MVHFGCLAQSGGAKVTTSVGKWAEIPKILRKDRATSRRFAHFRPILGTSEPKHERNPQDHRKSPEWRHFERRSAVPSVPSAALRMIRAGNAMCAPSDGLRAALVSTQKYYGLLADNR